MATIKRSRINEIIKEEIAKLIEVSRGSMKSGKTYTQTFDNGDTLYFRPSDTTNNGVKGMLYTVYAGRKIAGKNPKKYSVTNTDMDLWSDASNVPSNVESKLKMESINEAVKFKEYDIVKNTITNEFGKVLNSDKQKTFVELEMGKNKENATWDTALLKKDSKGNKGFRSDSVKFK